MRRWIVVPTVFPEGYDRDSWARAAAVAWSEQRGLSDGNVEVERLAAMLRQLRERASTRLKWHQIWVYLPDRFTAPLPVFLAIWRQSGERVQRLRLLSGADAKSKVGKPQVAEVTTEHLGTGLRVLSQQAQAKRPPLAFLSYAFRVEEHETDLQLFTFTSFLSELTAAGDDIERLVQGMTVYRNTEERRVAEP